MKLDRKHNTVVASELTQWTRANMDKPSAY